MRVENPSQSPPATSPKKSFAEEMKKANPAKPSQAPAKADKSGAPAAKAGRPGKPPAPSAGQSAPKGRLLGQLRTDAALARGQNATRHFESSLVDRRADAEVHRPEIKRVAAEIARILTEERRAPPPQLVQPQPSLPPIAPPVTPQPTVRAEALAGQIERIIERAELLSRAEGPALRLGLSEGSASSIEVIRTGKGEVALRLDARNSSDRRALSAKAGTIREALARRGLQVRELRVC